MAAAVMIITFSLSIIIAVSDMLYDLFSETLKAIITKSEPHHRGTRKPVFGTCDHWQHGDCSAIIKRSV